MSRPHATDAILTPGSSMIGGLAYLFAQVPPDAKWTCVALSGVGFLSLTVKSLIEYLDKRLDRDESYVELKPCAPMCRSTAPGSARR